MEGELGCELGGELGDNVLEARDEGIGEKEQDHLDASGRGVLQWRGRPLAFLCHSQIGTAHV